MKKQILFVIMAMCATCAMAVSLPSNSYNEYAGTRASSDSYTLGQGITFVNRATVGAYGGECGSLEDDWAGDSDLCTTECCDPSYPSSDLSEANQAARRECYLACGLPLGESPLDAPTAFLLALVAAYGAVAVYRKKAGEKVA